MAHSIGKSSQDDLATLSDGQLIARVLANDEDAIAYVFYHKYASLLKLNAQKAAAHKGLAYDDLVQDLYLYLNKNDWEKLRKYDHKYSFASWFTVISYRFFKDCGRSLIDSTNNLPMDNLGDKSELVAGTDKISLMMMDIKKAISKLKPPRDQKIVEALLLNEEEPADVAKEYGVTVDNLYNIKRRGIAKLVQLHLKDYQDK